MKPGDVWVVQIPALGTHEQSGTRPAVIIARVARTVATIVPCTSNEASLRFPYTLKIKPTRKNGLTKISIALIFHIRVLDVSFLERKIGTLDKKTLAEIRRQAHRLIG